MVDISERQQQIKGMVDAGQYFTINRARQYGKTTTLRALEKLLVKEYFLDFLAQFRGSYINRDRKLTFQSVILAGVYNVKYIRQKIRSVDDHRVNSPWNIAADFSVDMSFSVKDIEGMLADYERDNNTGMDVPVEAVKVLLIEPNTLFDSLFNKLEDYPELERVLKRLLFDGKEILYVLGDRPVEMALMFGFVKRFGSLVVVANWIFETLLYNFFLNSAEKQQESMLIISI